MQLQPNTLFHDRYNLLEVKGRGSFGEVWLARDSQTDMDVAVKVYIALDDRGVSEFRSEYRNAFDLNHPNLLHAYQFDICDNRPYLVMPYCPNSAEELIGSADEMTLWCLVRDVASGLSYLHGKGVIHRDIKPDNILIDKDGAFVISDFGISMKMRSTLQRNSLHNAAAQGAFGSIAYMAPEMFSAQADAVYASDIWALGSALYEIAAGELPLMGQGGGALLNGLKVEHPKTVYSKCLIDTILECLAKEPWDRPKAEQLVERAQDVLEGKKKTTNNLLKTWQSMIPKNAKEASVKFKKASTWMILAFVVSAVLFAITDNRYVDGTEIKKDLWIDDLGFIIIGTDFLLFIFWYFVLDYYKLLVFSKVFLWMIIIGFVCFCIMCFCEFILPYPNDSSLTVLESDEAVAFWQSRKGFFWKCVEIMSIIAFYFNFIVVVFSVLYLIVTRWLLEWKRSCE